MKRDNKSIIELIDTTFNDFKIFLLSILDSSIKNIDEKILQIIYWLKDWLRYLKYKDKFLTYNYKKFERGSIIKVNFGFNVGSELNFPHYAIVLSKNDSKYNPMLIVAPMTSIKETTNLSKLGKNRLNISNAFYLAVYNKLAIALNEITDITDKYVDSMPYDPEFVKKVKLSKKHYDELEKMKTGSLVHINQIRAISKMRVLQPLNKDDILDGIKISSNILDEINNRIKQVYL